ncbi:MAG: hypothetical protein A2806_03270 [Candidatus Terrybacteria bacterium RIFCSPHIGHO2_01_FULL_48_17]|uniref:Uncharacterized protein n=1 Tax=Candidatus Terrybacteria bacterium RIFCSPHIGHO2_01_FULL_48_17 TaxID=1802362 RepID=A0A1G2PH07_9BACT|nr:MAG: hypothetical protein A2806_03270 [Candidatus Terrybacteria bacterium RIFCSPHIGHO2_01_FULL_48_17]OHA53149.1 MAG: hypothetical protein A3A30_02190 [Candidatus Terrybacteria bacterium RIFCSPLOWO2_01_FULL_48_14]
MEQDKKTLRKERREQRKQNIGRARRFRTARTWGILALIVAAAGIAGWVWWFRLSAGSAEFSATESCVNHQTLAMHEHPRLSIIINGESVAIPSNIGVNGLCLHPIHTHDGVGTLHLEAPIRHTFVMGDFFTIWGKPFNQSQILDAVADEKHRIIMTVDGRQVETYETTELHDGQHIEIRYEAVAEGENRIDES